VVITVHGACKDAEGEFWKSFCKDYAWITGAAHGVTPAGKVLCATEKSSSCGGRSVCDPQKALSKWLALPEEERRPGAVKVDDLQEMDPAFPKRPAGSLVLKGYNRPLDRGSDGRHKRLKEYRDCQELGKDDSNWKTFLDPEPGRVWLWFSEEQWKSIVPRNPQAGLSVAVPDAVADRIIRLTLLNTIY
jgi:hypothetical protein